MTNDKNNMIFWKLWVVLMGKFLYNKENAEGHHTAFDKSCIRKNIV